VTLHVQTLAHARRRSARRRGRRSPPARRARGRVARGLPAAAPPGRDARRLRVLSRARRLDYCVHPATSDRHALRRARR
jgi:hypothetical protein